MRPSFHYTRNPYNVKTKNGRTASLHWDDPLVTGHNRLLWRHNERDDVSNHRRLDCLLNRLFSCRSTTPSKLRVTGLCKENSPVTGGFPSQRANKVENVFIWGRHHEISTKYLAWLSADLSRRRLTRLSERMGHRFCLSDQAGKRVNQWIHCRANHELMGGPWWRHHVETFFALLAICAGNSPVPGEFPAQRPMTRSFDVVFYPRLYKRLSKQSWVWWFETLSRP